MKIVSKKIRASARGQSCTLRVSRNCDHDLTVVSCHIKSPFKGTGLKSPDIFVAHCCQHCHSMLDSSKVDASDTLRAMQETQMRLVEMGLLRITK